MSPHANALQCAASIVVLIGCALAYLTGLCILGLLAASQNHGLPYAELRQGIGAVGQIGAGAALCIAAGLATRR
jgi:hypothetical protein